MKVEILNQYTQVWEVDGYETVEVFRTHKTLEHLIEDLSLEGGVVEGKWSDDGQVTVVYAISNDAQGSLAKVKEFNEKPFGKKGYHTLQEILKSDLVWVQGYGIVDDFEKFEH